KCLKGYWHRGMRAGRCRWKIENEAFNTLKNQGYHFEHNYGHAQQRLATALALLMLLAFLVDQIQQWPRMLFRQLWRGLARRPNSGRHSRGSSGRSLFRRWKACFVTSLFSIGYNSNETQIENCWKTKQTNK